MWTYVPVVSLQSWNMCVIEGNALRTSQTFAVNGEGTSVPCTSVGALVAPFAYRTTRASRRESL